MVSRMDWPKPEAFLDISRLAQVTDSRVRCTGIAICDSEGNPSQVFHQGDEAHFFLEFELLDHLEVPCGGLEFHDAHGTVIHGKNSFQYGTRLPRSVAPGHRLRFHQIIRLDVGPNHYWFTAGCASTDQDSYRHYVAGTIGHEQFHTIEHCRVADAASFVVKLHEQGRLPYHGIANLAGESHLEIIPAKSRSPTPSKRSSGVEDGPATVVHVTHWKAGSQWIHKILIGCAPDRIVAPKPNHSHFLASPITPGKVYPAVYVTKTQFDRTHCPPDTRRFVLIRDLRDTLVSGYFSMKMSHPIIGNDISSLRTRLQQLGQEEGLLYMLKNWLPPCAGIQASWIEAKEPLIRYEDLLEQDVEILESVLLDRCGLSIAREHFRNIVMANRFKNLTGGRERGDEERSAHERKGIAGDWRNYFTASLTAAFKIQYGGLLVAAGYERDLNW